MEPLLKIENCEVYGLEAALKGAGFPMQTKPVWDDCGDKDFLRGHRLGNTSIGSGHDKFLRQIGVGMTVTAPRYWWQEFATYSFTSINSGSTMHRITKMDIASACNPYVDGWLINRLQGMIGLYNQAQTDKDRQERFMKIKANIPEGLMIFARVTTNYAQLKTIYAQRYNHRLPEWREHFCPWIATLPHAEKLGLLGKKNDQGI